MFLPVLLGLAAAFSIASCKKSDSTASSLQILSFSPGKAGVGATLVINGAHFSPSPTGNVVRINDKPAAVIAATSSILTVQVPLLAGDGKISVQVGTETASSASNFTYVYTVSTIAGDGAPAFMEGMGAAARFDHPLGVAAGEEETVYVADTQNERIRKITTGGDVTTIAGNGTAGFVNGPGLSAEINFPFSLVADGEGNLFVADEENNQIRKITPGGVVSTLAGDSASGYLDGTGKDARFYGPVGIAIDGDGNLYVSDSQNQRIRKITQAGVVSTLAGNGRGSYKDGPHDEAEFNSPSGIGVDQLGNVYVADRDNNMIRKISRDGVVSTLAGNKSGGFKDATGGTAQFSNPVGLGVDLAGNVYVADWGNHRIRKISPGGAVTTYAGDGQPFFADGEASLAHFHYPTGVAVDHSGIIYVADQVNNRIRKVE
jgi:sugar lactone lactonase YvrE